MNSALGWIRRRLGVNVATPDRSRKRTARIPSIFDSLERREVLSTATLSPFVALPGAVSPASVTPIAATTSTSTTTTSMATTTSATSTTPTYYYGQSVVQSPGTVQASALTPVAASTLSIVANPVVEVSASDPDARYVQALYQTVLDRTGSVNEIASWVGKMESGLTPQGVATGIVNSLEHRQDEVDAFYEEFLQRTPDIGSATWVNALLSGVSEETVAEEILDSPEYQASHQDSTQFIEGLYLDVLDRQGEPAGIASWQAALASGESRQAVVASFVNSPEAVDRVVDGFYEAFLDREPESVTSSPWVDLLEGPNGSATDAAIGILSSEEFMQRAQ